MRRALAGSGRLVLVGVALLGGVEAGWGQVVGERSTAGRTLAQLAFVAGCWREGGEGADGLEELHTAPADNLMLGVSRFLRGGRAVGHEFLRVEQTDQGPVLTPHPGGVASVPFTVAELTAERVVWSNPAHDFPQRIIYHRVALDTLVARIEGDTPEGPRAREWRMARVRCPGE